MEVASTCTAPAPGGSHWGERFGVGDVVVNEQRGPLAEVGEDAAAVILDALLGEAREAQVVAEMGERCGRGDVERDPEGAAGITLAALEAVVLGKAGLADAGLAEEHGDGRVGEVGEGQVEGSQLLDSASEGDVGLVAGDGVARGLARGAELRDADAAGVDVLLADVGSAAGPVSRAQCPRPR